MICVVSEDVMVELWVRWRYVMVVGAVPLTGIG